MNFVFPVALRLQRRLSLTLPCRLIGALCLVLAFSGCTSVFYYPDQVLYKTPASAGLRFEELEFKGFDGTRLTGWFIPASGYANPKEAKGTVIQFHGNAQNMSAHWQFLSWLPQRGYNVFVFDYRGYGLSDGDPEPKGVFEDSNSALNYIRTRQDVDPRRLIVLGQSLGGTNAIAAVGSGNRAGVRAVVIESTFYSYSSIANDKLPGAGFLMNDTYSAKNYVAQLAPIPLLFLHGTKDATIPYAHTRKLFDQAGQPKRLVTIEGGEHLDAFSPRFGRKYQDVLLEFLDAAFSTEP